MYTENLYLEMGNIIMEATQEYDVAFYTFHLSLPAVPRDNYQQVVSETAARQKLGHGRADSKLQMPEQKPATAM
jgi:hypothetical protein